MSYLNHPDQLTPATDVGLSKPSIWQRMLDAVANGRQQHSERVYSDMVAHHGGRLTDELERQIACKL